MLFEGELVSYSGKFSLCKFHGKGKLKVKVVEGSSVSEDYIKYYFPELSKEVTKNKVKVFIYEGLWHEGNKQGKGTESCLSKQGDSIVAQYSGNF